MRLRDGIAEFLVSLSAERGLAANTVAAYRRDLAQYAQYLGAVETADPGPDLDDITPELVAGFMADLDGRDSSPARLGARWPQCAVFIGSCLPRSTPRPTRRQGSIPRGAVLRCRRR